MKCVWCDEIIYPYTCKVCGKGFKRICYACHKELVHSNMSDEEKDKKFPPPKMSLLKPGGCIHYEQDDDPWEQNMVRALEEQPSEQEWWYGEKYQG